MPRSGGFTLVEVLVAMAIMVAVAVGVARLFATAVAATRSARDRTVALALASAKIEQLRSLEWRFDIDASGTLTARTDTVSDLSVEPAGSGGPGLAESPPGTLDANVPPYVDYLDRFGQWAGAGPAPVAGSAYIRRWAVRHPAGDPDQLVALQVLVTSVHREQSRPVGIPHAWDGEDVVLATLVSRTSR